MGNKTIDSSNLREIALKTINKVDLEKFTVDESIKFVTRNFTFENKKNLYYVKELVSGTIKHKLELAFYLDQLLKDNKGIPKALWHNLLMALYQIIYMKQPDFAIINESVNLTKKLGFKGLSGLTNGVLRNFLRKKDEIISKVEGLDKFKKLSVRYSCPEWLVKYWSKQLSDQELISLLEANLTISPLYLRINPIKTTIDKFKGVLAENDIKFSLTVIPELLLLEEGTKVDSIPGYQEGLFYFQSFGSALVSHIAKPRPEMKVLDLCCFPGGKTTHLASLMDNKGQLIAVDLNPKRSKRFNENLERLGISNADLLIKDAAANLELESDFDLIVVDPPCSALGKIRRYPEFKYHKKMSDVQRLAELQFNILKNASTYLKEGGSIIYSTCTLSELENELVVKKFLDSAPSFEIIYQNIFGKNEQYLNLSPEEHNTDSFFICALRKV